MIGSGRQADPITEWLSQVAEKFIRQLESAGTVREGSASIKAGDSVVSIASVAGGKESNEDAVALWIPESHSIVRWAATIADGVSASLSPQLASRLASAAGLAALLQPADSPDSVRPVDAAQDCFNDLAEVVRKDPEAYRPQTVTNSMWKRVLRDSAFSRTTLIVVWQDDKGLHVEGVGDGGLLIDLDGNRFTYLPRSDRPVNCLGPRSDDLVVDYRLLFPRWSRIAVFTDGMSQWVANGASVFGETSGRERREPTAEDVVKTCQREVTLNDNVSLLIATRGTE